MRVIFLRSEELTLENHAVVSKSSYVSWLRNAASIFGSVDCVSPCDDPEIEEMFGYQDGGIKVSFVPQMRGYFRPLINFLRIYKVVRATGSHEICVIRIPDHGVFSWYAAARLTGHKNIVLWRVADRMGIAKSHKTLGSQLVNRVFASFERFLSNRYTTLQNGFFQDTAKLKSIHGSSLMRVQSESFKTTDHDGIVRFFGRISREKNLEVLVDAAAILKSQRFEIVGRESDEQYLRELQSLIGDHGLENVSFVPEMSFGPDLFAKIARSKTIILPSTSEGASRSILEALGFGVPVVVSNIPPNRDIIDRIDLAEHLTFDPADPSDLVRSLEFCGIFRSEVVSNIEAHDFYFQDWVIRKLGSVFYDECHRV